MGTGRDTDTLPLPRKDALIARETHRRDCVDLSPTHLLLHALGPVILSGCGFLDGHHMAIRRKRAVSQTGVQ